MFLKSFWRSWLLGVLGGLKRLGELDVLGAPGENYVLRMLRQGKCHTSF
jgi:hypothetical protein